MGRGELKRHIQHWWTSQEQTKTMSNTDSIIKGGVMNSWNTYSMGEQTKNKLTKQHMSKKNTITNWRGGNLRNTDNIGEQVKKKIIHSYILEFVPYFYTPISLTRGLKYVTKSAERFKQKSSNCRVLSERKIELEDIKWVSRSHQSQKDRQCNDKKKKRQ